MSKNWKSELLKTYKEAWNPPDTRPLLEWSESNISLLNGVYSIPGLFNTARSKYMQKILEEINNPYKRQINIMASPRCGKSLIMEASMLYFIANKPGPMMWLNSTDEITDKFAAMRLIPLIKSCGPVRDLIGKERFRITKKRVIFPHMSLNISSAKISALQSIGYQYLFFDEIWLTENGNLEEARARLGDFKQTYKFILASQAGNEQHDWNIEFKKYPIWEWGWTCPSCKKIQIYEWNIKLEDGTYAGVVWDRNEKTYDEKTKQWNIPLASKTARFCCKHCKFELIDNPTNRRHMNDNGCYINTNPTGDDIGISFRYNSMADIDLKLSTLVSEFLNAKKLQRTQGLYDGLEKFYEKRLALPFPRAERQPASHKIIVDSYSLDDIVKKYRFMSIDCQNNGEKFVYVIRDWDEKGNSWLVKHGHTATFEELRVIQLEFKIPDQCVVIDSGSGFASKVYAKCCEYSHTGLYKGKKVLFSWIALKGWDADAFPHPDNSKRLYSTESRGDPNMGQGATNKTCPLYRWSNHSIKNILTYLKEGKSSLKWNVNTTDPTYHEQMDSEILVQEVDTKTNRLRDIWKKRTSSTINDYFDCECMNIVLACMVGLLGNL
jgi:hypothetical protein